MDLLAVVFFLSGATSLVYQSIWARELHLLFGTSQLAIATVLAAFMTGLALGGAWIARRIDRVERPLRDYARLEAFIGVYALLFPVLVRAMEPGYLALARTGASPLALGLAQFVLLGAGLLLPTAAMGATLPLLVKFLAPDPSQSGGAVGRLYALNTAGAVAGTWLAGFVLLPGMGVSGTTWLAAAGNVSLAVTALLVERRHRDAAVLERQLAEAAGRVLETAVPTPLPSAPIAAPLLAVAAMAGFSSLGLEVAWFRLLGLVLGASTYAFTVMLLAFLTGIALGGHVGGRLADRLGSRERVLGALALVQGGIALTTWIGTWGYGWLPLAFAKLWFLIDGDAALMWPMKCTLAGAVMLLPAIGMGATFPLLVRAATDGDAARPTGAIYAANTVGSLLGAFLAGFVLLPQLRVSGTVVLCAVVNLGAGLVAWRASQRPRFALAAMVASVATALAWAFPAPWNPMLMTSGIYKYIDNLEAPTMAALRARMLDRYELLHYQEGLSTVVTVARDKDSGNIWLANNGKIDASSTADMPTQVLVAHLPFLFTSRPPERTALIGLASGITLGALTLHPEVGAIDVIELEPTMPTAARFFDPWNHGALDDPRVRLVANDGRNHLLVTPPGTYDILVSEPSNPWLTGVSNLFTREFFEMGKARLAPGGIWAQWVQMYGLDLRDLRAVMRTFAEVYPHVRVFSTIKDADLVLIGSDSPLELSLARAEGLVDQTEALRAEFAQIDVHEGTDLLAHSVFTRDTLLAFVGDVPLNTDDNLLVEFSAPKSLHVETSTKNFLALLPYAKAPTDAVVTAEDTVHLAHTFLDREDPVRALLTLKEAEARDPGRDDVARLRDEARAAILTP